MGLSLSSARCHPGLLGPPLISCLKRSARTRVECGTLAQYRAWLPGSVCPSHRAHDQEPRVTAGRLVPTEEGSGSHRSSGCWCRTSGLDLFRPVLGTVSSLADPAGVSMPACPLMSSLCVAYLRHCTGRRRAHEPHPGPWVPAVHLELPTQQESSVCLCVPWRLGHVSLGPGPGFSLQVPASHMGAGSCPSCFPSHPAPC